MQNPHLEKVLKAGFVFLVIVSLFFVVLTVNEMKKSRYIGGGVPVSNTITVSGEGEIFAVPDVAELTFSVIEEEADAAAAQEAAATKMNDVIAFLKDQGVAEKDIRTTSYNLYPRYEYRQTESIAIGVPSPDRTRVLAGYELNQSVSVKVRDTDSVGKILAGVGELGISNISGPSFTIDDEDALMRDARKDAIDDARQKAEQLADDLDVRLVRVVSFSEYGSPTPYFARGFGGDMAVAMDESLAAAPNVPTGENKITANVSITYEIR